MTKIYSEFKAIVMVLILGIHNIPEGKNGTYIGIENKHTVLVFLVPLSNHG